MPLPETHLISNLLHCGLLQIQFLYALPARTFSGSGDIKVSTISFCENLGLSTSMSVMFEEIEEWMEDCAVILFFVLEALPFHMFPFL